MGPGVAMECLETTDGPTIWEDHFYPEIVNPHDGTPLADGEHGELLFTTLTKEALPVIRYRTRDLTRLLAPDYARRNRTPYPDLDVKVIAIHSSPFTSPQPAAP